jgi:hypothetical protein
MMYCSVLPLDTTFVRPEMSVSLSMVLANMKYKLTPY